VLFNLALSGNAMPNTFYAKQAEYGLFWHSKPILARISDYLWPILASPFLVLIPAAVLWLRKRILARNWILSACRPISMADISSRLYP
jgi:hypothetical protein